MEKANSWPSQFDQIKSLKPIEVSDRALKKIELFDDFKLMRYLYTSTRDNLFVMNVRTCSVLRVKDLFNNFALNGSCIVND